MIRNITKATRLHKNELKQIKSLIEYSAQTDKSKIKIYWNIIQDRQTNEFNDFLFYIDGNLVGYLAIFTFKFDEVEISAIVHPKYRKQGIFKKLLQEAHLELALRRFKTGLFICNRNNTDLLTFLRARHGEIAQSVVEMLCTKIPEISHLPEVELRLASSDDVMALAKIGADCFDTPFLEVLQRFIENFRDKNRRAWLVYANNESIGKIHVRFDEQQRVFIHDLCILPAFRGKKYATSMIIKTMELLKQEGYKVFALDVECDNEGALELYKKCGFAVTAAYDYWRVAVPEFIKLEAN